MANKNSKLLQKLLRNATLYGGVKNKIEEFPLYFKVWRKGCKNLTPRFYTEHACGVGLIWLENNLTEEEWAEFAIMRLSGETE